MATGDTVCLLEPSPATLYTYAPSQSNLYRRVPAHAGALRTTIRALATRRRVQCMCRAACDCPGSIQITHYSIDRVCTVAPTIRADSTRRPHTEVTDLHWTAEWSSLARERDARRCSRSLQLVLAVTPTCLEARRATRSTASLPCFQFVGDGCSLPCSWQLLVSPHGCHTAALPSISHHGQNSVSFPVQRIRVVSCVILWRGYMGR